MPTTALLLALAAAFVHALWNILLARAPDVEAATAVALADGGAGVPPVAAWLTWDVERVGLAVHRRERRCSRSSYFALLATAYRLVPLSVVYPIARGGAPVLVL